MTPGATIRSKTLGAQAGATSSTPPVQRRYHAAARLGSYVIVAGGSGPELGTADADVTALAQRPKLRLEARHVERSSPALGGRAYPSAPEAE